MRNAFYENAVYVLEANPRTSRTVPGPEMRSTGEVLGLSYFFGRAFFKAREAPQTPAAA